MKIGGGPLWRKYYDKKGKCGISYAICVMKNIDIEDPKQMFADIMEASYYLII